MSCAAPLSLPEPALCLQMAKSKRSSKKVQQGIEFLPVIKKPMEVIGEMIKAPGNFWEGRRVPARRAAFGVRFRSIWRVSIQSI